LRSMRHSNYNCISRTAWRSLPASENALYWLGRAIWNRTFAHTSLRCWSCSVKSPSGQKRSEWWDSRGSCLITQKTVVTRLHEAFLPAPHTGLRLAGPAHNLIGADTVCAQQDDRGPPDVLMRCVAIPYDRAQTAAINRLEKNGNSGSHAPELHATSQTGIPSSLLSDLIH
jgi:hypothetical protein